MMCGPPRLLVLGSVDLYRILGHIYHGRVAGSVETVGTLYFERRDH